MSFHRELSPALFLAAQHSPIREILTTCKEGGADVRLHGKCIRIYARGNRILAIRLDRRQSCVCEIHAEYCEPPVALSGLAIRQGDRLLRYRLTEEFAQSWISNFSALRARAELAKSGPEGDWEARIVMENRSGTAVEILDRQVQIPRTGLGRRLDLLGVTHWQAEDVLVALELKRGGDSRIGALPQQVTRYIRMLTDNGCGLKPEIAASYQHVALQMSSLGLFVPSPDRIHSGMPVIGLVVLAARKRNSELLDRAHEAATTLSALLYWTEIDEECCRLASPDAWKRLGNSAGAQRFRC